MKVALISSVHYPECSKKKYDLVKLVLSIIPDYAGIDFDLFLINDGCSDDRLDDLLKNYKPRGFCKSVNYTKRPNKGFPKSLNELLQKVDSSYTHICHLDLDVLLPVYWLKKCCKILDKESAIGVCGVLVEDYLKFNFSAPIVDAGESTIAAHTPAIGLACLVFRSEELKSIGFDESFGNQHVDAYILHNYLTKGQGIYAILDRGHHPKEEYESQEFMEQKKKDFNQELPKFQETIKKLANKK